MKINAEGLKIIKECEGLRLKAYLCPSNKWTIGYGHTRDVKKGDVITEHQADVILELDLEEFEGYVTDLITAPLTENQFSALVSFVYNCGPGYPTPTTPKGSGFYTSTLRKKINAGDAQGAAREFGKWVWGGTVTNKVKLPGLIIRRELEKALFLKA